MWVYVWMWELVCNMLKEILGVGDTCGRSVVLVWEGLNIFNNRITFLSRGVYNVEILILI